MQRPSSSVGGLGLHSRPNDVAELGARVWNTALNAGQGGRRDERRAEEGEGARHREGNGDETTGGQ